MPEPKPEAPKQAPTPEAPKPTQPPKPAPELSTEMPGKPAAPQPAVASAPEAPKKKSKWWIWLLGCCGGALVIFIIAALIIFFFAKDKFEDAIEEYETFQNNEVFDDIDSLNDALDDIEEEVTDVTKDDEEEEDTTPTVKPQKVVTGYMNSTLGTLPDSAVDYDRAKRYLTAKYRKQFNDQMFVPTSYCIQDGPTEVKIKKETIKGTKATVRVQAKYGDEWTDFWDFNMIIEDEAWKINSIDCLAVS